MKLSRKKWDRAAGVAEKLGLTAFIASVGDALVTHSLPMAIDVVGMILGLLLLALGIIITPDE